MGPVTLLGGADGAATGPAAATNAAPPPAHYFTGDALPEPPQQHARWTPPAASAALPEKLLVATRELKTGDVMLMVGGGHGFRMLEDTVLLEVKQGPYTGITEKRLF